MVDPGLKCRHVDSRSPVLMTTMNFLSYYQLPEASAGFGNLAVVGDLDKRDFSKGVEARMQ